MWKPQRATDEGAQTTRTVTFYNRLGPKRLSQSGPDRPSSRKTQADRVKRCRTTRARMVREAI